MGDVLALGVGWYDPAQIQVQRLDGTRRRIVGHTRSGENGQTFVGLSFVGRRCTGRAYAGATRAPASRFATADGRFAHARVPRFLAGFAMASSGAYWVTDQSGICDAFQTGAQCQVQHAPLPFQPGRDPGDGP